MNRPQYVSDAIETTDEGLHVGRYGPFELRSAYQPIYRSEPGGLKLAAFEGLVRVRRQGAPVPVPEFFTAIEAKDRLFVECLCRALHLRNYRQAEPTGRDLFVNVDPSIYESLAVLEREFGFMLGVLDRYGLDSSRLVCEIVEHEATSEQLLDLRAMMLGMGIRVAMDDFGAGSSGIARYHELRPDVVKVDGALFRRLSGDPLRQKLLRAMARTLLLQGSALLVEGIETDDQLAVALSMGAKLFQGYGMARPAELPASFAARITVQQQEQTLRA